MADHPAAAEVRELLAAADPVRDALIRCVGLTPMVVLDADGVILAALELRELQSTYHVSADRFLGRSMTAAETHRGEPTVAEGLQRALQTGESVTVRLHGPVRPALHWEVELARLPGPTPARFALALFRDVTERHEMVAAAQDSEERLRVVADHPYDLVAELDAEGRVLWGRAGPGESRDFLAAGRGDEIAAVHPDDAETLRRHQDRFAAVGRSVSEPFRMKRPGGSEYRWYEVTRSGFVTAGGDQRSIAVGRDITDWMRLIEQHEQLERELLQAQKLESLGLLAGGVAHDFNNLLVGLIAHAELATAELPQDAPTQEHLRQIDRAARHAAGLTDSLLAYAGQSRPLRERVDLRDVVRDLGDLLEASVGDTEISQEHPDEPLWVSADPSQLRQIVTNLTTNAAESIGGGGTIHLRTGRHDVARAELDAARHGRALAEGSYVWLEVEDTGSGVSAELRERIFEPFFTTRFEGRGLGLAGVDGVVRSHAGALHVDDAPRGGARFRVLLPADDRGEADDATGFAEPARIEDAIRSVPSRAEGSKTTAVVLVVDDEEIVRTVAVRILERAGMRVHAAAGGREALELFERNAGEIDVVLLDLTMPDVDGEQVAREIRARSAATQVLVTSGYLREDVSERLGGGLVAGFLQKPYSASVLVERVRACLPSDGSA